MALLSQCRTPLSPAMCVFPIRLFIVAKKRRDWYFIGMELPASSCVSGRTIVSTYGCIISADRHTHTHTNTSKMVCESHRANWVHLAPPRQMSNQCDTTQRWRADWDYFGCIHCTMYTVQSTLLPAHMNCMESTDCRLRILCILSYRRFDVRRLRYTKLNS